VQPFVVDDLDMHSGESYSVLITTNQDPTKNYWMSVGMRARQPWTPPALTILNYKTTSASKLPTISPPLTPAWNDFNRSKSFTKKLFALMGSPKPPKTHRCQIILLHTQNRMDGTIKWAINNISLVLPSTPYLGSIKLGLKGGF